VSNLIDINPDTGALLFSTSILDGGGVALAIADLAAQPSTGTLFGITSPDGPAAQPGLLYTIDTTTGTATLIGDAGAFFGSIAFAPDGTLYMAAANLDFSTGNTIDQALRTLNPSTAATLTSVSTADFFGALAIRPTDSAIFGGTGDMHTLFTIDPTTGTETLIGDTGRNFVGDLAFRVPEPTTLVLVGLGLAGFSISRLRKPNG
jgi:outer membrane protein assembly factor BamB